MITHLDETLLKYFMEIGFKEIPNLMRANPNLANDVYLINETSQMCEHLTYNVTYKFNEEEKNKNYDSLLEQVKSLSYHLRTKVQSILISRITSAVSRENRELNFRINATIDYLEELEQSCKDCIEWQTWPTFEQLRENSWKQNLDACISFKIKYGTVYYLNEKLTKGTLVDVENGYDLLLFKSEKGLIYSYLPYMSTKEFDEDHKMYFKMEDLKIKEFSWVLNQSPLFSDDHDSNVQVQQGSINDSFLMAPAISIALSDPYFFSRKMVENIEKTHVYVKMFKKTKSKKFEPVYIEVNKNTLSFVNVLDEEKSLANSKRVLWPAILEKAYAIYRSKLENTTSLHTESSPKSNNAMKFLFDGSAYDCMEILTGMAYEKVNFKPNYNECTCNEYLNLELWTTNQKELTEQISNNLNSASDQDAKGILDGNDSFFWNKIVPKKWKNEKPIQIQKRVFNSWNDFLISRAKSKFFRDRIENSPPGKKSNITLAEFESLLDGSALFKNGKKANQIISNGIAFSDCQTWIIDWAIKHSLFQRDGTRHNIDPGHVSFVDALPKSEIMTDPQVKLLEVLLKQIGDKDYPILIKENSRKTATNWNVDNSFVLKNIHHRIAFVANPLVAGRQEAKGQLSFENMIRESRTVPITPLQLIDYFDSYTKKVEV